MIHVCAVPCCRLMFHVYCEQHSARSKHRNTCEHHVRPCNKMSLTRGLKQKKTIKLSAAKSGHDR